MRLEVEGDVLHITGQRRAMAARQGRNYHYLEQHYGGFERQLRLSRTVDRNTIQAEFNSGILSITRPKQRDPLSVQSSVRKDAS